MLYYNNKLKPSAQEMRKHATPQENKLWYQFLRRHTCPFARQKTIGGFIVDFYCHSAKLIIELDGSQHYADDGKAYDDERTGMLENSGFRIIRFSNQDVDDRFQLVCEEIDRQITDTNPARHGR